MGPPRAHRNGAAVLVIVGALLLAGCDGAGSRTKLPLSGVTKHGQRWRLSPGRPTRGDDVPASWCLRLEYATDVTLVGHAFGGGLETCGQAPARRVDGVVAVDCPQDSVFVFGGARSQVHDITLHPRHGAAVRATETQLPPRSGFDGYGFVLVVDARMLPARLQAAGAGQPVLARLPGRRSICRPVPGAPHGGEPFADFRTGR